MNFPFRNDAPGHFRSPDIGKAIQGLGKTVDPAQIEITITKAGYKVVRAPKIPNKLGAVQLDDFVLDPVEVRESRIRSSISAMRLTAAAARTSGRRPSTGD